MSRLSCRPLDFRSGESLESLDSSGTGDGIGMDGATVACAPDDLACTEGMACTSVCISTAAFSAAFSTAAACVACMACMHWGRLGEPGRTEMACSDCFSSWSASCPARALCCSSSDLFPLCILLSSSQTVRKAFRNSSTSSWIEGFRPSAGSICAVLVAKEYASSNDWNLDAWCMHRTLTRSP